VALAALVVSIFALLVSALAYWRQRNGQELWIGFSRDHAAT
jgi:hypothetical protein